MDEAEHFGVRLWQHKLIALSRNLHVKNAEPVLHYRCL